MDAARRSVGSRDSAFSDRRSDEYMGTEEGIGNLSRSEELRKALLTLQTQRSYGVNASKHGVSMDLPLESNPESPFSASPPDSPFPVHSSGGVSPVPADKKRTRGSTPENMDSKRKRKHNELEIRRRRRMNERFDDLFGQLHNVPHTRLGILEGAVEALRSSREEIDALRVVVDHLRAFTTNSALVSELSCVTAHPPKLDIAPPVNLETLFSVMSSVFSPVLITALNGTILFANDSFCSEFGYSNEKLATVSFFSIVFNEDLGSVFEASFNVVSCNAPARHLTLTVCDAEEQKHAFTCIMTGVSRDSTTKPCALMIVGSRAVKLSKSET